MKIVVQILFFTSLCGGSLHAEPCIPARLVPFDTFMNRSLSKSIPLSILVPVEYQYAPLSGAPATYSYWMTAEGAATVRKTGDLPVATGFIYGKLSTDVGYDPKKDVFIGAEDIKGKAKAAGFTDVSFERGDSNGHAVLFLEMTEARSRKKIYAMYIAMNVGTNAVYAAYRPPRNDTSIGDCFWKDLKSAMLESKQPVSSVPDAKP